MRIYKRTTKSKRMLFLVALLFLATILVSVHPVFSEDDRAIADQKRAQAAELREQAAEKRELVANKTIELNKLKAEKEKVDKEIYELEKEILPKKNEYDQLNAQYEEKINKYNNNIIESNALLNELNYGEEIPEQSSLTQTLKSEAGGPLGEIRNSLNQAAEGLENIVGSLKQTGLSDQEINKLFQSVGVNPTQLSQDLRQVSGEIPGGPMSQYELRQWHNKLTVEYENAKQDQAKARGPDYEDLKRQVAEYDAQIRYEEAQIRFWESEMTKHEENAREAWKPCQNWDIWGCIINIPKLVNSKVFAPAANWFSLVLGAQRRLNELKTLRGIPASRITFADIAASPYTFTVDLLDKQRRDIEDEIARIKDRIRSRISQLDEENRQLKADTDDLGNKIDKISAEIAPVQEKTKPLKQKSDNLQKDIKRSEGEINNLLFQASSLEGQAAALIIEAEAIESVSPARAGETCNPGIPMYQQPGCIENATPSKLSDWDGLPCPGPSVPSYAQAGCIPQ